MVLVVRIYTYECIIVNNKILFNTVSLKDLVFTRILKTPGISERFNVISTWSNERAITTSRTQRNEHVYT